jgi:membrane protein implicated in regulation of membrane protease activity
LEAADAIRIPRKLAIRMTQDTLELVFIGSALLGSALLLLSSLGAGLHVRVHLRLPHPRIPFIHVGTVDDATLMPMVVGFLALFGIGGLFGVAAGADAIVQVLAALAFGSAGAALVFAIFSALHRAQGREPTSLRELVGRSARVIVSAGRGARGTVQLAYDGALHTLPAIAESDIARGQEVVIVAVRGMAVAVRSLPPPP